MPRVICLGEALIDLFGGQGVALRDAAALTPAPGGAPANVAVALARLGVTTGFIGKVGADDYGAYLIELLAAEGIDTSYFIADQRAPTMLALIAAPSPTEQRFTLYHGANTLLRVDDLPRTYIESAAVFVYGSVTLASDSRDAALAAARWARQAQVHVIFDVNLRPTLWPDLDTAARWTWESVSAAMTVKLNLDELLFLTGTSSPHAGCQQLLQHGVQLCCVSLGDQGSFFATRELSGYVPPFTVVARDTTGSGDAFVAGLAAQLSAASGRAILDDSAWLHTTLRFANACGAAAATQLGGIPGMPTRATVEQLLAAQGQQSAGLQESA